MKLCVIGNSHVGMIRAALNEPQGHVPDCTFFAKAGNGIERAAIHRTVISAEDPELREAQARFGMPRAIDVAQFDAALIVAGTASIYTALTFLQDHRVSGWASSIPGQSSAAQGAPARPLISEPAFTAALADQARTGYAFRFAQAFRNACDTPLIIVPQPFPSARVFESYAPREYGFHRARRHGEGPAVARSLGRAIDKAFLGLGNVTVLHQPADTVAHGFTTARAFTRDAVRVDGQTAQHPDDLLHVGPAFGTQVLARAVAALETGVAA